MSFLREGSSSVWSRCKCFQAERLCLALGILSYAWVIYMKLLLAHFPTSHSGWISSCLPLCFHHILTAPITKSHISGSQQDADFMTRQQPDYAQLWLLVLGTPCNTSRDICEEFRLGCLKFSPSVVKSDLSVTLALPIPSWCLLVREPN